MSRTGKILSTLTLIAGTFIVVCYLIYFIACVIQQNFVTVFIPAFIIGITVMIMIFRKKLYIRFHLILCTVLCSYMLSFSAFAAYIYLRPDLDIVLKESAVVIVFGCRTYGMTPGRTLSRRLNRAFEILEQNKTAICLVSGGRGPNESIAEAVSMQEYLIKRGITRGRIIMEDQSSNTIENIQYTKRILDEKNLSDYEIIGVSSSYHLPRIRMLAKKMNLSIKTVSAVPADTADAFFTFADTVREYMAWIKAIVLNHI